MKLLVVSIGILLVAFLYYVTKFIRAAVHFHRRHSENTEAVKARLEAFAALPSPESGHAANENGLVASSNSAEIIQLEIRMLRLLCQLENPSPQRRSLLEKLRPYRFHELVCQVIYESLRELPPAPVAELAPELAAELTRRGFPDADLNPFFESPGPDSRDDGEELLQRLLERNSSEGA